MNEYEIKRKFKENTEQHRILREQIDNILSQIQNTMIFQVYLQKLENEMYELKNQIESIKAGSFAEEKPLESEPIEIVENIIE